MWTFRWSGKKTGGPFSKTNFENNHGFDIEFVKSALCRNRTCHRQLRRLLLYPTELRMLPFWCSSKTKVLEEHFPVAFSPVLAIGLEPIPQIKREQILSLSCIPISPSEQCSKTMVLEQEGGENYRLVFLPMHDQRIDCIFKCSVLICP